MSHVRISDNVNEINYQVFNKECITLVLVTLVTAPATILLQIILQTDTKQNYLFCYLLQQSLDLGFALEKQKDRIFQRIFPSKKNRGISDKHTNN